VPVLAGDIFWKSLPVHPGQVAKIEIESKQKRARPSKAAFLIVQVVGMPGF
jgi:hypothetical protein